MAEEYQPGLETSKLQIALQRYIEGQKVSDEEKANKANLIKSSAGLGKSVYDYWAIDQQGKYKDMLSQTFGENEKVFNVSDEYVDDPFYKRMFTPASKRVDMNPAYQKALDESKPKIPFDDLDLNEWQSPQWSIADPYPSRPNLPVDDGMGGYGVRSSEAFTSAPMDIKETGFPDIGEWQSPQKPISITTSRDMILEDSLDYFDDIPLGEDDVVSSLMREGLNTPPAKGGPMTASLGLNDSFMTDASGVDLLSSSDDALSATGVSSKLSAGLGLAGTALSAYDLATNWDDMSGSERAQGAMKTIGGGMMATGIGAVPGAIITGIGTIWDLLD